MKNEVLDFINRRFPCDCNWTNGNCFYFAVILAVRFNGKVYYDPINGHFVTEIKGRLYDWKGVYEPEIIEDFFEYKFKEPQHYKRIVRDVIE